MAEENKEFKTSVDHPNFYADAFAFASLHRKIEFSREADNYQRICAEEYQELSNRLDLTGFQESCSVRNVLRTRRLATLLINDKGDLNLTILPKVIQYLKQHLYFLGPNRHHDSVRQQQILNVLEALVQRKELMLSLKSITKPYLNKIADQVIRDSLALPSNTPVTDAHARRAVLAAWMCYLRQNVGSCFATAPAIIIHDEQPELFLTDIKELLGTGRLKRTFGGIEYSVPISNSWGAGDLKRPFYVLMGERMEHNQLWQSPGLIAALEAAGLVDPEASLVAQIQTTQALTTKILISLNWKQPFIILSAEEILRLILLDYFKITEKDLEEYLNRPAGMIQSGLLLQSPTSLGGKGEACANFQIKFDAATNAFKAIADNALLKTWEFTLASFSETKAQFTRWNLYASLGLGSDEPGGIGASLHQIIVRKLEESNQKVKDTQYEYETIFAQLKTLETRIRHATSEKDAQWIRMEYQSKRNEFYTLEDIRDEAHRKAEKFANLHNILIEIYDDLFPQYFQEVYDADMHDVNAGPYDDSPAGFRLLYKYGRSNTSQWSRIKTPSQFIESLSSFFTSTENEVLASPLLKGIENDISEITTAIVSHVRTKEFLETAFYRMAAAHKTHAIKDPLEHLDQIDKKPWAYTSGGTMGTLVSCYYRREEKPTEVARWVENPLELMVFLIDTLKQIPPKDIQPYLTNEKKSLLMHSPTHAFLLKPGKKSFKKAWQNDAFTFTWARDNFVKPMEDFIQQLWLDEEMMQYLIAYLGERVQENYRHYFLKKFNYIPGSKNPHDFREYVIEGLHHERVLTADEIDSSLYALLPLFSLSQLRERVENIFKKIPHFNAGQIEEMLSLLDRHLPSLPQHPVMSAKGLQEICKGLICLHQLNTSFAINFHYEIYQAMQELEYVMPAPIFFADTNWTKEDFAFVMNPGSRRLELWRIDCLGTEGFPMSSWEQWLNGSRKDITWGVYTRPYEYSP